MKSLHATSLLIMGASAVKINPLMSLGESGVQDQDYLSPSPNYLDWFEHPTYNDADYADYYTRDLSNAVNAADVISDETDGKEPAYLVEPTNQYWVENWYKDSSMPVTPEVKWDTPTNVDLTADQIAWRKNKWVDPSVSATND